MVGKLTDFIKEKVEEVCLSIQPILHHVEQRFDVIIVAVVECFFRISLKRDAYNITFDLVSTEQ